MEQEFQKTDFDYIILETGQITGVRGDKRYPLTKEEYDRMNPEHKNVDCKECTFVENKKEIFALLSENDLESAKIKPKKIGKFTMPKFLGHLNFYLFRCPSCKRPQVDYPHLGHCLDCESCNYSVSIDGYGYKFFLELTKDYIVLVVLITVYLFFVVPMNIIDKISSFLKEKD